MGSPRRRRADSAADGDPPLAPIQFRLEAREEQVTTDEGRVLSGRGYLICDPRTGAPLGEDDFFFRIGGGMICDLVGSEAHIDELQASAFRPGRRLQLVRRPMGNPEDDAVIEVCDAGGSTTVGELPTEVTDAIVFYGAESYEAAFCLWEWRTETGQRFALRLLLAPGWTAEELPDTQVAPA
jgi:hypothetical protein